MAKMSRRRAFTVLGVGGGLLGLGYVLRGAVDSPARPAGPDTPMGGGMMGGGMMGGTTRADMSTYMEMFNRHTEISRSVEDIPGGVRTTTESAAPDLVAQLQAHVSSMYAHLDQGVEVTCMSGSLPTLFRRAGAYRRRLSFTPRGVIAEETAGDPDITRSIRAHAREVTGFVRDGMPAMMNQMMRPGN
ncbi:MAG: hypothetical protein H0V92_01685 [Pseudonocardiales bacterium]|nr:hypothetical protein [Pseudonocardiales bacterium]